MIRLSNLNVSLDFDFDGLKKLCAEKLNIPETDIKEVSLSRKHVTIFAANTVVKLSQLMLVELRNL